MQQFETEPILEENYREELLDERDIALRQQFVDEYLVDYNPVGAALRLGFIAGFAEEFARKFMGEGYVRRLIAERESQEISKEELEIEKRKVIRRLKFEAHYTGPGASHGARVTALTNLAKIYGMEPDKAAQGTPKHKGGVMVVPALPTPDEWGKNALQGQQLLKQNVGN